MKIKKVILILLSSKIKLFLLKSILKIDFCVVNCLRHIAEINVQHRIKTFREGILR